MEQFLGLPGDKRNWIDAALHLILNAHRLFDLNLVKQILLVIGHVTDSHHTEIMESEI